MTVFDTYLKRYKSSEEDALVYLYSSLIEMKDEDCEVFLNSVPMEKTNTDSIVHILNALSPRKMIISNWNEYVSKFKIKLIELEGEELTKELMKVIL